MRPQFGNIGLGLAIGGVLAACAIGAGLALRSVPLPIAFLSHADGGSLRIPIQAPSVTPTSASTPGPFTAVPTLVGLANVAPGLDIDASPTPDVVAAAIAQGELAYAGPLTHPQQAELYRASLQYARATVAESKQVSKEINGVGYGDPSNICGPLAIAVLRDAGLIPPETQPHDFWLLDPRTPTDKAKLEANFPSAGYEHTAVATPLNKVDWLATPLVPGDFLFIWHGSGGNFDHMLVVNRVDSDGRAYGVTNFGTAEGYIIAETMLYDPHDPAAGIFHTWTQQRNAILGSTGFGGYEIWRLRRP